MALTHDRLIYVATLQPIEQTLWVTPGFLIRGLTVDNPSGLWLDIDHEWIAPWTLSWRTVLYGVSVVTIRPTTSGPGGKTGTATGSPIRVVATSYKVTPSPGIVYMSNP